jgi:hypothetical protein
MIKFSDGAHWYDKAGKPQHDADLRVARKQLLMASVTTIDKAQFKNDFLDRWKMNQLVIAASENARQGHESTEEYANRIYELSMEKATKAAEFGKEVHAAIEVYPQMPLNPVMAPYFDEFGKWCSENITEIIGTEMVLVDNDIGVAGRGDWKGTHKTLGTVILDFKTQDVKKDDKGRKKPAFYDAWPRQLAFYAVADAKLSGMFPAIPTCISLVIDSNEPAPPFIKVWDRDEIKSAYEDFVLAVYAWHKKRRYWPVGQFSVTAGVPMPE